MDLKSSAFTHNGNIPSKYTCDSQNNSLPITWSNVPKATKSFAIIMDDPDAPAGTWVHWVVWNLSADIHELPEGAGKGTRIGNAFQGITDFGTHGYGGPCPPSGSHRYFIKLFALDSMLDLDSDTDKEKLLKAMKGHILEKAELIGIYARKKT